MKMAGVVILALATATMAIPQERPTITVKELPPEAIPAGTCTESLSGYLGVEKNGKTTSTYTPKQIGDYVAKRLSQGYSVTLYPQPNGRVFAIATCQSKT